MSNVRSLKTVVRQTAAGSLLVFSALGMGICPVAAAGPSARQVVVVVTYQTSALQVTDSSALAIPLHHAGRYVEWTNEHEFLASRRLTEHATYEVTARVARVEVRQFPPGWGERSGKYYSTYFLRAMAAKRLEGK